jgi:hypothetical protein
MIAIFLETITTLNKPVAANEGDAADSHEPRTLVLLGPSPRLMPAADLEALGH